MSDKPVESLPRSPFTWGPQASERVIVGEKASPFFLKRGRIETGEVRDGAVAVRFNDENWFHALPVDFLRPEGFGAPIRQAGNEIYEDDPLWQPEHGDMFVIVDENHARYGVRGEVMGVMDDDGSLVVRFGGNTNRHLHRVPLAAARKTA